MFFKLLAISFPVFFAIDMVWIGFISRSFYRQQIGQLLKTNINWPAAIIFYLIFLCALIVFVIAPAVEKKDWLQALKLGALFGLVTYATYDLTNLAVTKDWPLAITIVDLAWGVTLSASVSVVTYFIATKVG